MKRYPLFTQAIVCDHCGCAFEYTLLDVHSRDEEGYNKNNLRRIYLLSVV